MCSDRTLKNFIESFVREHTLRSGGELVLNVSPEDIQALGDFFVRGICGWALSLESGLANRRLVEVTEVIEFSEPLEVVQTESEDDETDKGSIN